jgi:hypothetical protein
MKNNLEMSQAPMDFFNDQASFLEETFELTKQEGKHIMANMWAFTTYDALERCMANTKKIIISNEI